MSWDMANSKPRTLRFAQSSWRPNSQQRSGRNKRDKKYTDNSRNEKTLNATVGPLFWMGSDGSSRVLIGCCALSSVRVLFARSETLDIKGFRQIVCRIKPGFHANVFNVVTNVLNPFTANSIYPGPTTFQFNHALPVINMKGWGMFIF